MNWNAIARTLRLIFFLRVPLLTLALLGVLGPAAYNMSMISNLLDQEGNRRYLFNVSFAAFLLAFTAIAAINLTLVYGKERFDEARHFGLSQKRPLVTFVLGSLTAVALDVYVCRRTLPKDYAHSALFLVLGALAAFAVTIVAKIVQLALTDPATTPHPPDLIFPAYLSRYLKSFFNYLYCWSSKESKAVKGLFNRLSQWPLEILRRAGQGYLVPHDHSRNEPLRLLSGHVFAGSLAIMAFLTYLGIGLAKSQITRDGTRVPALAFVLLYLIVACWMLSALSFFFDRYRFPLFWVLLALLPITGIAPQSDHFFRVAQYSEALPEPPTAAAYLTTMLTRRPVRVNNTEMPKNRLVFVATPGGGIQAAAWTAKVLTELGKELENEANFPNSIAAISSVSGGSLGAIIYGKSFVDEKTFPRSQVTSKAEQSAIDQIAWGLTVPDFWRTIIPWLRIDRTIDRGWALEKQWSVINDLHDDGGSNGTMLSDWIKIARAGRMPALIINSMIVERGQPVVFSTTRFPKDADPTGRIANFYDLYSDRRGHYDVRVNTAARLSASFPYVAPAARPDIDAPFGSGFHFVDGGYYDNFGINSLLSWLDEGLADPAVKTQLRDVLILQIRHFNTAKLQGPKETGWSFQLGAPLLGLYNMRDFAQNSVANNQIEFFARYYARQDVRVWRVSIDYEGEGGCADAPLSWKLDRDQRKCIAKTWDGLQNSSKQKQAIQCLKAYLKGQRDLKGTCPSAEAADQD